MRPLCFDSAGAPAKETIAWCHDIAQSLRDTKGWDLSRATTYVLRAVSISLHSATAEMIIRAAHDVYEATLLREHPTMPTIISDGRLVYADNRSIREGFAASDSNSARQRGC